MHREFIYTFAIVIGAAPHLGKEKKRKRKNIKDRKEGRKEGKKEARLNYKL